MEHISARNFLSVFLSVIQAEAASRWGQSMAVAKDRNHARVSAHEITTNQQSWLHVSNKSQCRLVM
jgi:hypothetical protein